MQCIFCKHDSNDSRSIEHIIPESLGNESHILPKGVVCDKCNNYFSRKVEKPFLDLEVMKILRFHQIIPSKRGNIPPVEATIGSNYPATVIKRMKDPYLFSIELCPTAFEYAKNTKEGKVMIPAGAPLPVGPVVSRFLAKVALEAMAQKLIKNPAGIEYLVNEIQLDSLRNHARYAQNNEWPFYSRRIHDPDKLWINENGNKVQVVHEFDIFKTEVGELYFVLSIFGMEFAINYAGPAIDGYIQWLKDNDNASPLYYGKNSESLIKGKTED
ncbi:HNH endonuclease [Methanolobus zinderi]|uniref:HNH endonuclease n=1 Tax=Methanolobus zinderi TaxID=536044 RepID=A0A7D5EGV6_9EURY|nr:HNH endonuclease [Methanolobus zinderi]QLC50120.1 HNH endonuclease [Methanolobus zinderi]